MLMPSARRWRRPHVWCALMPRRSIGLVELIVPFDPATQGDFDLDSPPAPWIDLGWVENFQRTAATKFDALRTGPSSNITAQYRTQPEARVEFDLLTWGKVQLGVVGRHAADERAGGAARVAASAVGRDGYAGVAGAEWIDVDAARAYLRSASELQRWRHRCGGCGLQRPNRISGLVRAGTYLAAPLSGPNYIDFVRRITFQRLACKRRDCLQLAAGGAADCAADDQHERAEGGGVCRSGGQQLFPGMVGLFIVAPDSGGRTCFYYPRLQPAAGAAETRQEFAAPLFSHQLHVSLRALPTTDTNDNETVLCYRSYFPAATAAVEMANGTVYHIVRYEPRRASGDFR